MACMTNILVLLNIQYFQRTNADVSKTKMAISVWLPFLNGLCKELVYSMSGEIGHYAPIHSFAIEKVSIMCDVYILLLSYESTL